jgi:hypothetical protein
MLEPMLVRADVDSTEDDFVVVDFLVGRVVGFLAPPSTANCKPAAIKIANNKKPITTVVVGLMA